MNQKNPLAGYFRQPKHYTALPSNGRWYPHHAIEWPATGELAVLPMTARDEITIKTPDALLNGQSTAEIIQSCVPAIKDAWFVPTIDLDVLLIAIRIATYGPAMEINPRCPKCAIMNHFTADLKEALARNLNKRWNDCITVNDLKIHIRPLSYRQLNNKQLKTFEEQRLLSEIQRSDLNETEKLTRFNDGFRKLNNLNIEIVLESIDYIETAEGDKVADKGMIEEFLKNADRNVFESVNDLVKENKETFTLPPLHVQCDSPECKHEWDQELEFDLSNFFELKS